MKEIMTATERADERALEMAAEWVVAMATMTAQEKGSGMAISLAF